MNKQRTPTRPPTEKERRLCVCVCVCVLFPTRSVERYTQVGHDDDFDYDTTAS